MINFAYLFELWNIITNIFCTLNNQKCSNLPPEWFQSTSSKLVNGTPENEDGYYENYSTKWLTYFVDVQWCSLPPHLMYWSRVSNGDTELLIPWSSLPFLPLLPWLWWYWHDNPNDLLASCDSGNDLRVWKSGWDTTGLPGTNVLALSCDTNALWDIQLTVISFNRVALHESSVKTLFIIRTLWMRCVLV